jgi:hypothetical protein
MADANKLSNWSVNDSARLPGRQWKRSEIRTQFMTNRPRFRKKKTSPTPVSHRAEYGTASGRVSHVSAPLPSHGEQKYIYVYARTTGYLLECSTFATPPVAY